MPETVFDTDPTPMPEPAPIPAPPAGVTPEEAKATVALIRQGLALLSLGAGLTPTEWDDRVLARATKVLDVIEPLAADPELLQLVDLIIGLFKKGETPSVLLAKFKAALQ